MKLDLKTFGASPAAMYLAQHLNERGDKKAARKAATRLLQTRTLLNGLVAAQDSGSMTVGVVNSILHMIDNDLRLLPRIEFTDQLVSNILTGEIRALKARATGAKRVQKFLNKQAELTATAPAKAALGAAPDSAKRNEELFQRSREYLARKGKQNTLYP